MITFNVDSLAQHVNRDSLGQSPNLLLESENVSFVKLQSVRELLDTLTPDPDPTTEWERTRVEARALSSSSVNDLVCEQPSPTRKSKKEVPETLDRHECLKVHPNVSHDFAHRAYVFTTRYQAHDEHRSTSHFRSTTGTFEKQGEENGFSSSNEALGSVTRPYPSICAIQDSLRPPCLHHRSGICNDEYTFLSSLIAPPQQPNPKPIEVPFSMNPSVSTSHPGQRRPQPRNSLSSFQQRFEHAQQQCLVDSEPCGNKTQARRWEYCRSSLQVPLRTDVVHPPSLDGASVQIPSTALLLISKSHVELPVIYRIRPGTPSTRSRSWTSPTTSASLQVYNVGTTATYYEWKKQPIRIFPPDDPMQRAADTELSHDDVPCLFEQAIRLAQPPSGSLLPGEARTFLFVLVGHRPGVFTETWHMHTIPAPDDSTNRPVEITIRGVVLDDAESARPQIEAFQRGFEHDVAVECVRKIVSQDILGEAGTGKGVLGAIDRFEARSEVRRLDKERETWEQEFHDAAMDYLDANNNQKSVSVPPDLDSSRGLDTDEFIAKHKREEHDTTRRHTTGSSFPVFYTELCAPLAHLYNRCLGDTAPRPAALENRGTRAFNGNLRTLVDTLIRANHQEERAPAPPKEIHRPRSSHSLPDTWRLLDLLITSAEVPFEEPDCSIQRLVLLGQVRRWLFLSIDTIGEILAVQRDRHFPLPLLQSLGLSMPSAPQNLAASGAPTGTKGAARAGVAAGAGNTKAAAAAAAAAAASNVSGLEAAAAAGSGGGGGIYRSAMQMVDPELVRAYTASVHRSVAECLMDHLFSAIDTAQWADNAWYGLFVESPSKIQENA